LPRKPAELPPRHGIGSGTGRPRRATVTILHGLDDRTLRDIGVSRAEISSLIYGKGGGQRRVYDADWRCHLRGCP
jgi:hypothetical protein